MKLCGCEIGRGEKRQVKIPVSEGVSLKATLLCGQKPGKTLVVTAGVHGCEYVGILALERLTESLDLSRLSGQLIALPLLNPEGFFSGAKQINPLDGKNLNREFPGNADGTITQKIAKAIERWVYPEADFLLDLHGGDWNESMTPLVFFPCGAGSKLEAETRAAARMLSVSLRVCSAAKNGLYSWAAQQGIPALLLERGGNGRWTPEEVDADREDILRLMAHLKMLEETPALVEQQEINKACYEEAPGNGCWFPAVQAGDTVCQGALLGTWKALEGQHERAVTAAFDATVLYETTALGVRMNDPLIAYGAVKG